MPDERPNIILIMPDQMRGDCLSCDDHPAVLTPNVDQLAAQGTRFSRGYSTIPSCIPARRCLLTGQFPATSGVVGFGGGPIDVPTLPGMLRDHGYQTHMVGRYMHQTPASCRYGFDSQTLGSSHVVGDLFDQFVRHETDHVDGFFSHGLSFNGWTARAWHMDEAMHPTNWVVNESLRFLQHRDETCPFFLTMSFYAPHPPLCPPQFFMDRYLRMNLPEPAIGDWEDPVPPGNTRIVDAARVNLTGEQLRNCQAGYFGLIEHIDNQINRLLSFRGPGGYNPRNTVVIFTSDHGEMLGDHYLFRKCEPFEGSARVPFVIAGGGDLGFRSGQVVDSPVCLEDLMPTCLDLAGVDVPDTVDGESLVPVLRGEADAPRRAYLHGEHAPCYSQEQAYHSLTDGHMKYIWRPTTGRELLFNLDQDPHEKRNLAASADNGAAATTLHEWRSRMIEQLTGREEGFVRNGELAPGRTYKTLMSHATTST